MNIEQARFNMVEQQVRTWNVLDGQVLDAIASIPRERFVPASYQHLAFADTQIPLEHGQAMSLPREDARMLQALQLKPTDKVLEIGTGSGYSTALLASLAQEVISIDLYQDLLERAEQRFQALGLRNVKLLKADAARGLNGIALNGPFDAIALTGAVSRVPLSYFDALSEGGRLFAIVGQAPVMTAILFEKKGDQIYKRSLFETRRQSLVGAEQPAMFQF